MIQMATINAAEFMRVDHLVGSIAPGKLADILLVDNLADFNVRMVMADGQVVARDGRLLVDLQNPKYPPFFRNTVRFASPEAGQFRIDAPPGVDTVRVRVLVDSEDPEKRANAGCDVEELSLAVADGAIVADPARRIAKVVVMDRHSPTGKIGKGFAKGPYLARGAVGTSYTNQTEDVAIVGMTDEDIALCARTLQEMGGGWCAVLNGKVLAKVEMPLCGLMADEPFDKRVEKMKVAYAIGREVLGSELEDPYRGPGKLAMCVTHSPTYHIGREGLVKPFERVPLIVG
jgi:adenine deaminase